MAVSRRGSFPPDYTDRVLSTFQLIDDRLNRCVRTLDPEVLSSPFSAHAADVTAARHAIVADHCRHVRGVMSSILERQHIPAPVPATSAQRSARALIDEALVAAAGLNPRTSAGPGAMNAQQQEDACRIVDEMMNLLLVIANDLGVRKDITAITADARAQPVTGLDTRLSDMKQVSARHGLARLESCVDALAARVRSGNITIGVFGESSAGKSSLLNCILGTALLPVATMPTTAVPVEISYGPQECGSVDFADAISERFERGRLAEFVDAHSNPQNRRHVTHIQFNTPAAIPKRGVTLIDVPGSSCAPGHASLVDPALMFRCDLAIVLISAVASLTLDEAQLVDELHHAGLDTMVLVTKADLLAPEDRWHTYGHVVHELWRKARYDVPAYLVSTKDTDATLCKAWQDGPLTDYIASYPERQTSLLTGRANLLAAQIRAALEQRVERGAISRTPGQNAASLQATLDDMQAKLQHSRDDMQECESASFLQPLINEVSHNAAALWAEEKDVMFDVSAMLELAATAYARNLSTRASWRIEQLRSQAAVTLVQVANALEIPGSDLGYMPALPELPEFRFDRYLPATRNLPVTVIRRGLGSTLGRWGFYLGARRALRHSPAIAIIKSALADHIATIGTWRVTASRMLFDAFAAQRSGLEQRLHEISTVKTDTGGGDEWLRQLEADISRLREPSIPTGQPAPGTAERLSESTVAPENHPRRSRQ
ncbi:dynamin family protein [Paraburkholderia sp.]|uniref:dynamin family protein n=1 Tax=Paraburkholderia sp. TaxID=1926495 RepID=UPI0039E42E3F